AEPPAGSPYFSLDLADGGPVRSPEAVQIDFRLTPGVWLTGRVVEARTGKPVGGARVEYYPHAENRSPAADLNPDPLYSLPKRRYGLAHGEAVTGPDGRFRVLAVAGRGWVLVRGPGGTYAGADRRALQGDVGDR